MSGEPVALHLTRRLFIQSSFGALTAVALPACVSNHVEHFILHKASGMTWPVEEPVSWTLKNVRNPFFERARSQLLSLLPSEADRVRRLITRRCGLNLIRVQSRQVEVQYWSQLGLADLRPLFKSLSLATDDIKVVLIDRKRECPKIGRGSDFRFGVPFFPGGSLESYWNKWRYRYRDEPDDWTAAPLSPSSFGWRNVELNVIPWAALKSMWRRTSPIECLNCDRHTIITKIDSRRVGIGYVPIRSAWHACADCSCAYELPIDDRWLLENLDRSVWPDFEKRGSNGEYPFRRPT